MNSETVAALAEKMDWWYGNASGNWWKKFNGVNVPMILDGHLTPAGAWEVLIWLMEQQPLSAWGKGPSGLWQFFSEREEFSRDANPIAAVEAAVIGSMDA